MGRVRTYLANKLLDLLNAGETTTLRHPAAWFTDAFASPTDAGIAITAESAMRQSAVYRSVDVLAKSISGLPVGVVEVEGEKRTPRPDHRIHLLLHETPNETQTPVIFKENLMVNCLLRGDFYASIGRTRGNEPLDLNPIDHSRVSPERVNGRIQYRVQLAGGGREIIDGSDMLHVPGLGFNGFTGQSVITFAARQAVGLSLVAEKHGATMFRNGTRMSGYLHTEKKFEDEEAKRRLGEQWQGHQGGVENVGKTPVLEDGLKWEAVSMTAEDAQYLELRRFQIADIARFFGVPLHMLFETEKSTSWGSGLEQFTLGFIIFTLQPWIVRIEQEFQRKLLPGRAGQRRSLQIKFNLDSLLRGDSTARSAFYTAGIEHGWLMPNEVRAKEDLKPQPGGNQLFIQSGLTPLVMAGAIPQQPTAAHAFIQERI